MLSALQSLFSYTLGSEYRGVITPAVAVPNRRPGAQARYGIGETLALSAQTVAHNAAYSNTLRWHQTSGTGNLRQSGVPGAGNAGYTAGTAQERVTLELRGGPALSPKVLDRISFDVVKPGPNASLDKIGDIGHTQGTASAGFRGRLIMKPNDVSFMGLEFKEGAAALPSQGTGVMAHSHGIPHAETPAWVTPQAMAADGTRFNGYDTVSSTGINPPVGGWVNSGAVVGRMERPIQWKYRIAGRDETITVFQNVTSRTTVYANGDVLRQKADASRVAHLNDPTDP